MDKELIQQIATELRIPVEKLWEVLVQGQAAEGTLDILSVLIFIVGMVAGVKMLWSRIKKDFQELTDAEDITSCFFVMAIPSVGLFFSLLLATSIVSDGALKIISPEYCVARKLIK